MYTDVGEDQDAYTRMVYIPGDPLTSVYILTPCVYRIPRPLSVDPSSVGTTGVQVQLSEKTGFPGKEKVHVSSDESVLLSLCSAAFFSLIMRGKQPAQIRALFLAPLPLPLPPNSSTRCL